jgi:hypothetical protein
MAVVAAAAPSRSEAFPVFFARFVNDDGFRISRIKFPLRATLGNPTDPRVREKWSKSDLATRFTVPVATERLEAEGLVQELTYPSGAGVEVQQSLHESDSHIMIYRFKLKSGQWFLVEFEDGSY